MNLKKMIIGILLLLSLSFTATYASKITFCDVTEQTPYYTVWYVCVLNQINNIKI